MDKNNKYTVMQKKFYEENASKMALTDHVEHNSNPDYWNVLLGDLTDDETKTALDFGCGTGRNVINLLKNWSWNRVDGVDISQNNINEADKKIKSLGYTNYKLYSNNGVDLSNLLSDEYDFVMSTIVFQHICVYDIRFQLMKEIHRVLKSGGLFSFQMGFGNSPKTVGYYENYYDAESTNSDCDVRVEDPSFLYRDLEMIGFVNIRHEIRPSWSNVVHNNWIYVKAEKK